MKARIICKFKKIVDEKSGVSAAGKDWTKKQILVFTPDDNNEMAIDVFGDKRISALGDPKEGAEMELDISITANEWKGKYYSNIGLDEVINVEGGNNVSYNEEQGPVNDISENNASSNKVDDEPPF